MYVPSHSIYPFSITITNVLNTAICVGVILMTSISIVQEKIASRFGLLPKSAEARLYFACFEAALLPIGLFWFGWTSYPSVPWIVPMIAVGCATMGIYSVYLAVFNYLADTYHRYASSAIAAQSFCMLIYDPVWETAANSIRRSKPTGGSVPSRYKGHVHQPGVSRCVKSSWWDREYCIFLMRRTSC